MRKNNKAQLSFENYLLLRGYSVPADARQYKTMYDLLHEDYELYCKEFGYKAVKFHAA